MKMNGTELDGRALSVAEARPKEDSGGRQFGPDRKAGAFQRATSGATETPRCSAGRSTRIISIRNVRRMAS